MTRSGPRISGALAGTLLAALFLGAYALVAATIGFDGPPARWEAYGEPPVGRPIQQPICFWTDLGFVLAGIAVLRRLDLAAAAGAAPANPMSGRSPHSVALGLIIVWMGPASMLEHGTLATTWGWFDATSIHWLALFVVGYLVLRWIPGATTSPWGRRAFWASQAAAWLAIGAWTWRDESVRARVSGVLLALLGIAIVASLVLGRLAGLRFTGGAWRAFAGLLLSFVAAVAFLVAGAKGGVAAPWGHGAWHLSCAASTFFIARLLAAEAPRITDGLRGRG